MSKEEWFHIVVQKGNPQLKEVRSFIIAIHMPVIVPEGDAISIFQDFMKTFPFFQRDFLSAFSKSVYCARILSQ